MKGVVSSLCSSASMYRVGWRLELEGGLKDVER